MFRVTGLKILGRVGTHVFFFCFFFFLEKIYMSAHVLLNLLNKLRKRDKMGGLPSILSLFRNRLVNSIIQEHEC